MLLRRRRDSTELISPVLPVVFYTGDDPWPNLGSFADLVEQAARFQPVLPTLTPLFLNLVKVPAEQLETEGGFLGGVLRLFQGRHAQPAAFGNILERAVTGLEAMTTTERGRWLELLSYVHALVYHGREPSEHVELQHRIAESVQGDPHRKEVFGMGKTIADSLIQKGRKKGRKEGRELEAVATRQKMLLVMLEEHFGPLSKDVRQAITTTDDVSTLDGWFKDALKAQSLEDISITGS